MTECLFSGRGYALGYGPNPWKNHRMDKWANVDRFFTVGMRGYNYFVKPKNVEKFSGQIFADIYAANDFLLTNGIEIQYGQIRDCKIFCPTCPITYD